jgi:hypothetical protein
MGSPSGISRFSELRPRSVARYVRPAGGASRCRPSRRPVQLRPGSRTGGRGRSRGSARATEAPYPIESTACPPVGERRPDRERAGATAACAACSAAASPIPRPKRSTCRRTPSRARTSPGRSRTDRPPRRGRAPSRRHRPAHEGGARTRRAPGWTRRRRTAGRKLRRLTDR